MLNQDIMAHSEHLAKGLFANSQVASVGINRAIQLKKEIIQWMTESGKYRVYNTMRISTKAVFEYLSKDIDEYKGGY